MGGTDCLYESYPDGTAKHTFFPLDVEGEINDVRARGSPPLEWYFQVGMHWRYADEYERISLNYKGEIFLEITSRSFDVAVKKGDCLNQLRLVKKKHNYLSDDELINFDSK